ncbi:cell wall galactomannoprotein [Aspergillus aurantiobrunneus]
MRSVALLSLLAFPVAILADYNTVLVHIDSISTLLTDLTESVDAVTSGIPGLPFALQVQVDATTLDKQIITGAQNANASEPFGGGSLQVGLALLDLQPVITSSLDHISEKNTTFGELGIIVLASLLQLKRHSTAFSDQIVPKLKEL